MSWHMPLFGTLLTAALVAHVFMLAGHDHSGAGHASTAAVVTHVDAGTSAETGAATTETTDDGSGAAALGAACLVILVAALHGGCRRSGWSGADGRSLVRRQHPPWTTELPRVARPLRPPRTPIAERVVLLT